jgi:hypothetical protein
MTIFEITSLDLNLEDVKKRMRKGDWERVQTLLDAVKPLISARAAYDACYIDQREEGGVVIGGIRFVSQVLKKNLEKIGRVFPYVVTIGPGLEERSDVSADFLDRYYLDVIGNVAVTRARKAFEDHLRSKFALSGLSYMSPGSLQDWPIEEQAPLFSLLKEVEETLGVRLTESFLMIPRKSVSGIYFPTEVTFHSCQLCPRENCEGRRAPFDETLAREYGLRK